MNDTTKIIALLYHEIIENYNESGFQNKDNLAYMHKISEFKEHIHLIKKQIQANENSNTNILLTFDDGGVSNLNAAKILEENELKGIFFVTTNMINKPFFLSSENIKFLHSRNHIIGSHSHTHPMIFRSLSYNKMLEEWKTSKQILEDIVQQEVVYCSVPGGDADEKTYQSAMESGYKYIFDSEPEITVRKIQNSTIIGRFSVKSSTNLAELEKTITLKNLSSLQRNRKIKNTIKRIIFPIHSYLQNKKNNAE